MELFWVSHHLSLCWLWDCYILPFLSWIMSLISLISPVLLSWRVFGFCQRLFLHLLWCSCGIWSLSLFIWWIKFIDLQILNYLCISGIKLCWSWWVTFLLFSCIWYFIENFCLYVHKKNWSAILYPCWIYMWFGNQGNSGLVRIGQFPFCFTFVE